MLKEAKKINEKCFAENNLCLLENLSNLMKNKAAISSDIIRYFDSECIDDKRNVD